MRTNLNQTQKDILQYISDQTKRFQKADPEVFTANYLAGALNISQNSASQYLNEFAKEGILVKTNSRPVYFLHRETLEEEYHIRMNCSVFAGLSELQEYLRRLSMKKKNFAKAVGNDAGLSYEISQCRMAVNYPPSGLPLLFSGPEGTGKSLLAKLSYEYAADQGLIDSSACKLRLIPCRSYVNASKEAAKLLFGDEKAEGLLGAEASDILYFKDIHILSREMQDQIAIHMEGRRMFFSTTLSSFESMSRLLLEKIPVIVRLPALEERSMAEKEQMIVYYYKQESIKIRRPVQISRRALELLLNYRYERNVRQLKSYVQTSCMNAFQGNENNGKKLSIQAVHLPEELLRGTRISDITGNFWGKQGNDSELLDIDQLNLRVNSDQEQVLYQSLLESYEQVRQGEISFDAMMKKSGETINAYFDYMVFEKNYSNEKIRVTEQVLTQIFQDMNQRYDTSLTSNFAMVLARIIYNHMRSHAEGSRLVQEYEEGLWELQQYLQGEFRREYGIMEEIASLIEKQLEIALERPEQLLLLLKICQNHDRIHGLNTRVLVVCHGYSTASSIADVVNQIYGKRIFDAIDMPIDTKTSVVVKQIERYLETALNGNVIIMVDIGSLETIDSMLNTQFDGTLGIMNNVSTRLALDVGDKVLSGMPLPDLLREAKEGNTVSYRIIEKKKKEEAILFVSELGNDIARKVSQLFLRSIPKQTSIHFLCHDYEDLRSRMGSIQAQYHILFCAGMVEPALADVPFIYLEDIISFNQIETVKGYLSEHLNEQELAQFHRNLLKNFSLQNVIEYLTILNADKVLEFVDETLEQLQIALGRRFSAKTIIGLNIHISCLVERLVKKTPIMSHMDKEIFVKEQKEFIDMVRICFRNITDHYGVELPISEIHYVWDYIYHDTVN